MTLLKPLMMIEYKNKNFAGYVISIVMVYAATAFFIGRIHETYSARVLDFIIIIFVLIGLILSLSMTENLKNDEDSNVIKTYISYPITPYAYIAAKSIVYLIFDLVAISAGSLLAVFIIGKINFTAYEIFMLASLFSIFSSFALYMVLTAVSRYGIVSEVVLVFYYFIYLFAPLVLIGAGPLYAMYPFTYPFSNFLDIHSSISIEKLITLPLIYLFMIIITSLLFKIFRWKFLFNYKN